MAIIYEQEFAPSEQASLSVDALVNDFDIDTDSHMGLPPSRGHILQQPRRATPTIPPGFSAPATPRLPSETPLRPLSRTAIAAGITPAVPLLRTATPVKSKIIERHSDLLKDHPAPDTSDLSTPPVTVGSKDLESHKNPSQQSVVPNPRQSEILEEMKTKDEARQVQKENTSSAIRPAGSNLTGIKSPSKSDLKTKRAASDFVSTNKSTMTTSADYSPQKAAKAAPRTVSSPSKRQPPGKLDIAAATKLSEKDLVDAATMAVSNMPDIQMKNARAVSLAPTISHPSSPAVPSTGSPIKRSAPRTIRVLPTPKSENPPPLSASSAASMPPLPSVVKLRSRQASVTSLNQPGTPASEFISDNASIASTSISRANSPPPGTVVGSAPIRQKTKTQAKRERQERAKQIADEKNMVMEDFVKSSDPEPVQAPIVGRKKKAKKSAAVSSNATAASTPAISLPASPKTATHNKAEEERDASESSSSAPAPAAIPSASATKKASPTKSTSPTKSSQPLPPSPDPPKSSKFTQSSQSQPTAASILADLQRTGDLLASTLEFFKPLSASISHLTRTGTPATSPSVDPTSIPSHPDLRIHFSEADLDALAKKLPVHLGGEDGKTSTRTLITPQGKFLWGLSKELEERVLELEKRVEEIKGIARWRPQGQKSYQHPQLHNATGRVGKGDYKTDVLPAIATALKEAGAKLGKQAQTQSATSSTGTKYATHAKDNAAFDDALAYLNQWVLPSDSPQSGTLHTQMPRSEAASVGGPAPSLAPSSLKNNADFAAAAAKIVAAGGGDAHRTANLAAAAKLVAAGGGDVNMIPIPDLENLGVFAAEVLGGYVVQGLEALVGVDGTGGVFGGTAYGGTGGVSRTYGAGEGAGGRGGAGMGGSAGSVLSLEEAEQAMIQSRKEAEQLEKKVNALVKRNRKILSGAVGGR
ncbi:hypothetical protein K432DRAFT_416990 [Lepidopterella palustris CBS 459.81]|uniref:Uncharacterized protein n=1 Tax=Lepidopterella palustris CBS 459.81 TaxID=1314670 RepID=A0A8E2EA59_9PEZI|nr:hypothetical protein K432DRAFT_416990 [Lepidopterella palustris CBS 459.81]